MKLYQVLKCIAWFQCSMGTALCCSGSVHEWIEGSKMVTQTWSKRKEPNQQLKETVHTWRIC